MQRYLIGITFLSFFSHLVLHALGILLQYSEAVVQNCSVKRVFLKIVKLIGKLLCRSLFLQNCRPITKDIPARSILKTQTSHYTSLDKSRRLQTSHQTSADESLDKSRRMQTRVDKSLDKFRELQTSLDQCRRVQTNLDKCKRIKKKFFDINGGFPRQMFFNLRRFLTQKHR